MLNMGMGCAEVHGVYDPLANAHWDTDAPSNSLQQTYHSVMSTKAPKIQGQEGPWTPF